MIGKWMFKQLTQFQVFIYRRSGGKTMGTMRGMPLLLLTTMGRKTGQQRVTPVMYIRDGDNYVITASYAGQDKHPSWFVNLKANPQATIQVGKIANSVMAHQANPEEKKRLWAQLVEQAPFFEDYQKKTTRDIPMMILKPADGEQQVCLPQRNAIRRSSIQEKRTENNTRNPAGRAPSQRVVGPATLAIRRINHERVHTRRD